MKKIIALVLALLLVSVIFAGCGGGAGGSVAGTYKAKLINGKSVLDYFKSEAEVEEIELSTLLDLLDITEDQLDKFMVVELKEDGSANVSSLMSEEKETSVGTWKQEGSKVIITIDDEPQEFTLENGQLKVTLDELEIVLTK